MNDLLMFLFTSSLPNDPLARNSTMIALLSSEKHCAFPVYVLSVGIGFFPLVMTRGHVGIITVIAIVLLLIELKIWNLSPSGHIRFLLEAASINIASSLTQVSNGELLDDCKMGTFNNSSSDAAFSS